MTGYDFVTIDLEHEPINDESVADLVRTADAVGLTSIARVPISERVFPFLSAGVQGVQLPDLRRRAHAEQIVELTRFPPLGRRTYYTQPVPRSTALASTSRRGHRGRTRSCS